MNNRYNNIQMLKDNLERIIYYRAFASYEWPDGLVYVGQDATSVSFSTVNDPEDFGAGLSERSIQ